MSARLIIGDSSNSVIDESSLIIKGGDSSSNYWGGKVVVGGSNKSVVSGELNRMAIVGAMDLSLTQWQNLHINPKNTVNTYIGNSSDFTNPSTGIVSVIGSTANVGINKVNPNPVYTLDVSGDTYVNGIQFNLNPPPISTSDGFLKWNSTDGTLDLGMKGGDVTQQIGQELFVLARNATGVLIPNATPVYINGRQGNRPKIYPAQGRDVSTSCVIGLTTQDFIISEDGYVTTFGYVRGIKTNYIGDGSWGTTWTEGDLLWVSKDYAGQLTNVEPRAPHHSDIIGSVAIVGNVGIGSILVNILRHNTLEELSDIDGTPLTTTGQIPVWNDSSKYFDFNYNILNYALKSNVESSLGNYFVNGGNSFGINASLGTKDNYSLSLKTNNINRVVIDTSGNVGINNSNPTSKLQIDSSYNVPALSININDISTSGISGINIFNNTVSSSTYTNQYSPAIQLRNHVYYTGSGGGDDYYDWKIFAAGSSGATTASQLYITYSKNGATESNALRILGTTIYTFGAIIPLRIELQYSGTTVDRTTQNLLFYNTQAANIINKVRSSSNMQQWANGWNGSVQRSHRYAISVTPVSDTEISTQDYEYSYDGGTNWKKSLSIVGTYGVYTPNVKVYNCLFLDDSTNLEPSTYTPIILCASSHKITINNNDISTNIVTSLELFNNTLCTSTFTNQYSPALQFRNHVWDTDGSDDYFDWKIYASGTSVATTVGQLTFLSYKNNVLSSTTTLSNNGTINTYAFTGQLAAFSSTLTTTPSAGITLYNASTSSVGTKVRVSQPLTKFGYGYNGANKAHYYRSFVRPIADSDVSEDIEQYSTNGTDYYDVMSRVGTSGATTPNVHVYNNLSIGTTLNSAPSAKLHIVQPNNLTSINTGIFLENNTASDVVNTNQYSGALQFRNHVWDTDGSDDYYDWKIYTSGLSGSTTASNFNIGYSKNGASLTPVFRFTDATAIFSGAAIIPRIEVQNSSTSVNYVANYLCYNINAATGTNKIRPSSTFQTWANGWNGSSQRSHRYAISVTPVADTERSTQDYEYSYDGGTNWAKSFSIVGTYGATTPNVKVYNKLLIGNTTNYLIPIYDLSFDGSVSKTIGVERNTLSNTAGNNLSIKSGGATIDATDASGGNLILSPGLSTGTGKSNIILQRLSKAASTGTTDNTLSDAVIIPSEFNLTNSSANSLFDVSLGSNSACGGTINFTIQCSDGTDFQTYTGNVSYAAVNKAGVYTTAIPESGATFACSTGTITTLWSIVSGTNKVTIKITPTSSLTPTSFKIKYVINNSCGNNITML